MRTWATLASSFVALAVHAADISTLPEVVVTGSELPASETPVSQSAIVIPEAEIKNRAPVSLPDLLRSRATVYVDQPGAPGGFSALYLRGADPSHTVIMIDGVKVSDPTNPRGGGIDLSLIDPHTIDRVEILPGASSAIYGADAIAGVVNIITRVPGKTGLRANLGAGGEGYRSGFVGGDVRSDVLAFHAEAAASNDGHTSDTSFNRLRSAAVSLQAGDETDRYLVAALRSQHHEAGSFPEDSGGPVFAVRRELERRETDGIIASLKGGTRTPLGSLRIYSNTFSQDADTRSPGVAPGLRDPFGLPASRSAANYRRWTVGAISVFGSGPEAPALVGIEYQKEQGEVDSMLFFGPFALPANFALERRTRSAFTEGRVKLTERLVAQAGFRADGTDAHGTHTSVQTGLRYDFQRSGPSIALNYGTGFKPPSFFALGHPIVGNPQLRPEESRTLELSIASGEYWVGHSYRAAVFRSEYRELVDFDPGPPPRLVNRDDVQIKGADIAATSKLGSRLTVHGSLTALTFDLPEGSAPLRSRPRLRAAMHGDYKITHELGAALYGSWTGRAFDSSIPTDGLYLSPYLIADAAVNYIRGNVRFTFAVDNLLDRQYQQFIGFPGRGRRARVEVAFAL